MNRVLEASELEALARRRERPLPIPLLRLAWAPEANTRRVCGAEGPAAGRHAYDRFAPALRIASQLGLEPEGVAAPPAREARPAQNMGKRAAERVWPRKQITYRRRDARPRRGEARGMDGEGAFRKGLAPRAAGERRGPRAAERTPLHGGRMAPRYAMGRPGPRGETRADHLREYPQTPIFAPGDAATALAARRPAIGPVWLREGAGNRPVLPAARAWETPVHPPEAGFTGRLGAAPAARAVRRAAAPEGRRKAGPFGVTELRNRGVRAPEAGRLEGAEAIRGRTATSDFVPARRVAEAAEYQAAAVEFAGLRPEARVETRVAPVETDRPYAVQAQAAAGAAKPVACQAPAWNAACVYPAAPRAGGACRLKASKALPEHPTPRAARAAARVEAAGVRRERELTGRIAGRTRSARIRTGAVRLAAAPVCEVPAGSHPAEDGARRQAEAPFAADAILVRSLKFDIQGTFAGTLEETADGGAVRLEEDFGSGLVRWIGGTDNWRLDAAGVRPGALALFGPSLGMRDYEVEFLAKVESRGLGWVFRAENLENYHAVRLEATGTAQAPAYELKRWTVIAGREEPAVRIPLQVALRSRAAFKVQTTAADGEFTTAIDGQVVDRWSDDRLREGGAGFLAAKDDRARLYWMKVSSRAKSSASAPSGQMAPAPAGRHLGATKS